MQIDKQQIIDLLRSQGEQGKAQEAEQKLPNQVDPQQHSDLLSQLGINPQELLGKLGGLGGLLG